MSGPRTIDVRLEVLNAEEALRIAGALEAVIAALWHVYGEEMSDRRLEQYCAAADPAPPDEQFDLPF